MAVLAQEPACSRFRVHLAAELPSVHHENSTRELPIELRRAIQRWQNRLPFLSDAKQKEAWVNCIRDFIFLDSNHNHVPDWTAVVDGRPSRVLFPLDPDMDGDGIPNLLDPNPYTRTSLRTAQSLPVHLKMKGPSAVWQQRLWQDFHIVAVNHTDRHLPETLKIFDSILRLKSLQPWLKRTHSITTIYAFNLHDPSGQLAAYHPTARAISVPGKSGFGSSHLSREQSCQLASALVHELGHAVLFDVLNGEQLRSAASRFGKWLLPHAAAADLLGSEWLVPFQSVPTGFVSSYAATNVHEWFAESFAANVWQREGLNQKYCEAFPNAAVAPDLSAWLQGLLL